MKTNQRIRFQLCDITSSTDPTRAGVASTVVRGPRGTGFVSVRRDARRSGASLIEMIVSCVLLGAVLVTAAPLMGWVSAERRAADQRQFALLQATNLMESIGRMPWDQISTESLGNLSLSAETTQFLKAGELTVELQQQEGPPVSKRVTVRITWNDRAGQRLSPAELSAWFYHTGARPQ